MVEECAIPGGDNRIAARRHKNIVGNQLLDAGALVVPGHRRIPLEVRCRQTVVFQTPTPSDAHSLFGAT